MQSVRDEYTYYIRSGMLRARWAGHNVFTIPLYNLIGRNMYIGNNYEIDAVFNDSLSIL